MNYLIDTHALIWWVLGDTRLPVAVQKALGQAKGQVWVSVASLWEMVLKIKLGKLKMPEPFEHFILKELQTNRMEVLPIHSPHAFETLNLPPHHRDPFDRILVAQARKEELVLISGDEEMRKYDVQILW